MIFLPHPHEQMSLSIIAMISVVEVACALSDLQYEIKANSGGINYLTVGAVIENGFENQEIAFKKGLEAANKILKESPELKSTRLVPAISRVGKGDSFQASQLTCDLLRKGVVAILGPKSTFTTQHVQSICNKYGIPLIIHNWGYHLVSDTYSINVHPDHVSFGKAILDYLKSVSKQESLAVVYEEEENLLKYEELMNNFHGRIILRQWSNNLNFNNYIIKYLRGTHLRSFLIDLPYWKVRSFLSVANKFNMTTQYYNYFFTSWDITLVNLQTFKLSQGANITAFSMTPYIKKYNTYRRSALVEDLRKETYKAEVKRSAEVQYLIPTEVALIYDGVSILGYALDKLSRRQPIRASNLSCGDHRSWAHGLSLVNEIKEFRSATPEPLTGDVAFDESGRRANFTLKILEVATHGYQQYGYWRPDTGISVTKKYSQTKEEIYKHLQNTTLRVTTIADPPFVIIKERDSNGNPKPHPDAWEGFCIELLKKIAKEVNFNFTIHEVRDKTYGKYNGTHSDGTPSWDGMIGELMDRTADLAVASLTITYDREKVIDFTTPFMSLGLSILYRRPKRKKPHLFSFLQPLSPPVWGYVLAAYILVSFVLFVVARFSPYEWYNPHPCNTNSDVVENQFNILNSLWFTIGSLMQQGSDMAPRATSTRIVGGIWWFFTLIIISSYTANLAAFLTVERMKSPIENAEDLSKQTKIKYGTLYGGSTYTFFSKSTISTYQRMWQYMSARKEDVFVKSTKAGIERVMSENYAFILESTWNEFYTQRNCSLMQVGGLLDSKGYGIGLPQGSIYRNMISEAILKLQNEQKIDKLKRIWWTEFNVSENCESSQEESKAGNNALGLEQVGGVFVVLMSGLLLSIFVSFLEFMYKAKMNASVEKLPVCTEMSHELRFAVRCMASSKKPSNRRTTMTVDANDNDHWSGSEEDHGVINSSQGMVSTYQLPISIDTCQSSDGNRRYKF